MTGIFSCAGKTALVTGASSGLGRHFARVLHEAGASVILAARRVDRIEADAAAYGDRAMALRMDVSEEASIRDGFARLEATHPPVDIVINNAGIGGSSSLLLDTEASEWDSILQVNLRGVFLVAREAARRMAAAKVPGSIVNVASVLGLRLLPGVGPYMASKAAVIHLTRSMAYEFARYKIRVNAICPGYFDTEINSEFLETEYAKALIKRTPQRRIGDIEDLTGPLLLLASNAGAYMTGEAIVVDGGQSIGSM